MTTACRATRYVHEPYRVNGGTNEPVVRLIAPKAGGELRKDETMRKLGLAAALAASIAVTGCTTYPDQYGYDPYGYNNGYYNNGYYNNGYYGNGYNNGYYGGTNGSNVAAGAAV